MNESCGAARTLRDEDVESGPHRPRPSHAGGALAEAIRRSRGRPAEAVEVPARREPLDWAAE